MLTPEHPLSELGWIPRPRLAALRRLQIETVEDLLTHYPRRYEDRREFPSFPRQESDQPVCVCGEVTNTSLRRFGGWKKIFEATLQEENANALSQPLTLRWFNMHYIQKMIATGQRVVVFGKPRLRGQRICMEHPEFEIIENDEEISVHFRRITPIHPATEGLSQRGLRSLIHRLLEEVDKKAFETLLPEGIAEGYRRPDALQEIHFPASHEALADARRHLVLSEFFAMQMVIADRRTRATQRKGQKHSAAGNLSRRFLSSVGFELTAAQRRVIEEVGRDMRLGTSMNRLLQGDVGSGKTVVAIAAMLLAVESGMQAALMAPTQILAEQHYNLLRRWLQPLGLRLALRTSARAEESGPLPLFATVDSGPPRRARLQRGGDSESQRVSLDEPQIIVGTHALLYEGVEFTNLGLAVIDEQHKFGVAQRARLTAREPAPDVLVMTATPIPRTLTMTFYGDLEVSTIDEMPRGRGKLKTALRSRKQLPDVLSFARRELEAGRQLYVVYPLIEESGKIEAKAATQEFQQWQTRLQPHRCELLHGRIPAAEKDSVMERFRAGTTKALISTTVIEVGVDVPNATMMLIENAERFGLSQLHQLRGRIGRGAHDSYCVLLTDADDEMTRAKLDVLVRTSNGFEVAEADWELRGPGDLLGTSQSGLPELKLGDLRKDADLMRQARAAALQLLEEDPQLEARQNQRFQPLVVEQTGRNFAHVS